jgi:Rrf2 family cysteine metabolism transcriptional repressor
MKLSTRSRYGLRAMLVLALHVGDEPVMTKDIAEKQNLPATYLEQLMLTLRKSGLVLATRGAKGGYLLSQNSRDINLAKIIEALEGPIDIADCADIPNCCSDPDNCAIKEIYSAANKALYEVFAKITLEQLAEKQKAKGAIPLEMYYI